MKEIRTHETPPRRTNGRQGPARVLGILFMLLLAAEIALRFMPVREVPRLQDVTPEQPIHRFVPDERVRWSRDWNFSIVNDVRVNNAGFVNAQDYPEFDPRPQLAVIGDSYVEALMVPYADTLHGRLAAASDEDYIVYSYGARGARLGQYLAYAQFAQSTYGRGAMIFVVTANVFDESARSTQPTFHQFVEGKDGQWGLARPAGYKANALISFVMQSALVRYVRFNLGAADGDAVADEGRLAESQESVDAFFRLLPQYAQIPPEAILFVVDADREAIYDPAKAAPGSYFAVMRSYFMEKARGRGYGVIDMAKPFAESYRVNAQKFEFSTDRHWNADGHEAAYEAVRGSAPWLRLTEQLQ